MNLKNIFFKKELDRIERLEHQVLQLHELLLHQESYYNGFITLKKHLQRPDKPLPRFAGKEIEQD